MAKADFPFRYPIRVRWSETDAQGVVFNARFLDYADIAITEYLRETRVRALHPEAPFEFHVKRATLIWHAPIRPDEMIEVMARTAATGRTSMTQFVEIHGAGEADDLRAEAELVNVHVDLETGRPAPLPGWLPPLFDAFDQRATALDGKD